MVASYFEIFYELRRSMGNFFEVRETFEVREAFRRGRAFVC